METINYGDITTNYSNILQEIKSRIYIVSNIIKAGIDLSGINSQIEICALQIRKCIELMQYAALIANKKQMNAFYHINVNEMQEFKNIRKKLEEINPYYFPIPQELLVTDEPDKNGVYELIKNVENKKYLQKNEVENIWKECSRVIHANNPLTIPLDYEPYMKKISCWTRDIMNLLEHHTILIVGESLKIMLYAESYFDELFKQPSVIILEEYNEGLD